MNARQRWLALALAITVAAVIWPARENDLGEAEIVSAVKPGLKQTPAVSPVPQEAAPSGSEETTESGLERFATNKVGNLFPRQTWVPPPPPPPKPLPPPPPPPPSPPPLPFTYMGRWVEAGQETLFLTQGDHIHHVRKGDVLAGNWRLDGITPNQAVFTYLPLDMTRTLRITP